MNKKQVNALLKVMSKDDSRPVLCTGYVDKYEDRVVLVVTDGYKLAAVYMDGADELVGKMIRREAIERWYKLADGKSRLTGEELVQVSSEDYGQHNGYAEGNYPQWQGVVPKEDRPTGQYMAFNADFVKVMQDLDGNDSGMRWYIGQPLEAIMAKSDNGVYIVMPLKK